MKKILLLIVVIIITANLYAQVPQGIPSNNAGMEASKNIGHVYGKILDENGKPVNGASVLIMETKMDTVTKKMKQLLVSGMITKGNGDFDFVELPVMSKLQLKISNSGYKALDQNISFMPKREAGAVPPTQGNFPSFEKDLGNIKLTVDATQLQGVTIAVSSPVIRLSADKKIFNVEKNIMSAGGTGIDVMRNVPSVNVDIDGNVTFRNSAPQLLVDGRPTHLPLTRYLQMQLKVLK